MAFLSALFFLLMNIAGLDEACGVTVFRPQVLSQTIAMERIA
jgi:hypothetical protein